jgi:glycosyltransferase involved in cell wall biosynthesis
VALPVHWGQPTRELGRERMRALFGRPGVRMHDAMRFTAFQEFMSTIDVALDLFAHTLEREYAVVTRSVSALACGVPVVHPPFTEVSPLIEQYDAGWLVDPDDTTALDAVLDEVVGNPGAVAAKAANARRLWQEQIDPAVAVEPLVRIVEGLSSE